MKGRAAASPDRAGVTGGRGRVTAIDRGAAPAPVRRGRALVLLAGLVLAVRCALALAQTTVVPEQTTVVPEQTTVVPEQTTTLPAQTTTVPADFTVGDIKVEGLQRVSEGTVYNY